MAGKMQEKRGNNSVKKAIFKQMIVLSTSGLGLVAALSWNNVIQEVVENFVKPYLPNGSGIISLLVYALVITVLAVVITTNLTKIEEKMK